MKSGHWTAGRDRKSKQRKRLHQKIEMFVVNFNLGMLYVKKLEQNYRHKLFECLFLVDCLFRHLFIFEFAY